MFVKPKMEVTAVFLIKASEEKEVVSIELPIKENYVVTEAPPTVRGNTAQGGNKQVTIEGGATVTAPLFVNTGDIIRVNTETGEYVERIEKAS
jgi:elongation factor P